MRLPGSTPHYLPPSSHCPAPQVGLEERLEDVEGAAGEPVGHPGDGGQGGVELLVGVVGPWAGLLVGSDQIHHLLPHGWRGRLPAQVSTDMTRCQLHLLTLKYRTLHQSNDNYNYRLNRAKYITMVCL